MWKLPTQASKQSGLGVQLAPNLNIAAIGQADDTCLLSSSISHLQNLINLTMEYCRKFHVELVPEKTKLIAFQPASHSLSVYYSKLISNVNINGAQIEFTNDAEHVGIQRSNSGNLPHILKRFTAHKKAISAIRPAGLALNHAANPAAALRVERIYRAPVLLNGLSSLVLSKTELTSITTHYKGCLESLMKLHKKNPSVVHFLAGSLPAAAILHINMFSL